jgi:pimeloyl-ACP methyl ester carboxylesterase
MEPNESNALCELSQIACDSFDSRFEERRFRSGTRSQPIAVVEVLLHEHNATRLPIIMIHGGFHTGRSFLRTPDNRAGWAHVFAQRGHKVLLPDWPGHGMSPGLDRLTAIGSKDVAEAIGVLVQEVGQCILLAHSAGGPVAWWLTEAYPELIAAVIGVAPGSPANLLEALPEVQVANATNITSRTAGHPIYAAQGQPVEVDSSFIKEFWANSALFPTAHLQEYIKTVVPESPRILNERFNIGGTGLYLRSPELVAARPILIVTGENDLRHPRHVDAALANFLKAKFYWLPDEGIRENGHMQMLESNSHDIAALLVEWLNSESL